MRLPLCLCGVFLGVKEERLQVPHPLAQGQFQEGEGREAGTWVSQILVCSLGNFCLSQQSLQCPSRVSGEG